MRKLKLRISEDTAIDVRLPNWGMTNQEGESVPTFSRQSLLQLSTKLAAGLITFSVVIFGLLFWLTKNPLIEVPALFLSLMFVVLSLGLIGLTLAGWRYLVDPPLFVHVLIFALIVIAGYLFVPVPTRIGTQYIGANTFGIDGSEYLAGLYIMGFIGLFYFTHLLVNTRQKLSSLAVSLMLGLAVAVGLSFINQDVAPHLQLVVLMAIPVFFNYLVLGARQLLGVISVVGVVIGLGMLVQDTTITLEMLIAVLAGLIGTLLLVLKLQNWEVKSPISTAVTSVRSYLNKDLKLIQLAKENSLILTILALVTWFTVTVLWILTNRVELNADIQSILTNYSSTFNLISEWPNWLLGRGITLEPRNSVMASIILYQGLLGALAYLLLGTTAIYITIKAVTKEFKEDYGSQFALVLAPIIIMVPIIGLLGQLSFIAVALWWIAFAYMAVSASNKSEGVIHKVINELKLWRFSLQKHLTWVQLALVGVIIIATMYFIPLLQQQLT